MNLKFKFFHLLAVVPSMILLNNKNYSTSATCKCSQSVNKNSELNASDSLVDVYKFYINVKQDLINEYYAKSRKLEDEVVSLQNKLNDLEETIQELNIQLKSKNTELLEYKNAVIQKGKIVDNLKLKLKEQKMLNSKIKKEIIENVVNTIKNI